MEVISFNHVLDCIPNAFNYHMIWHFIKDPVSPKHNVIEWRVNSELDDLWDCDDDLWISSICWDLRFYITKSSWNRESPWLDSRRAEEYLCIRVDIRSRDDPVRLVDFIYKSFAFDRLSHRYQLSFWSHFRQLACDLLKGGKFCPRSLLTLSLCYLRHLQHKPIFSFS